MAARLTDKQKKKIVADYLELGSYNAAAKEIACAGKLFAAGLWRWEKKTAPVRGRKKGISQLIFHEIFLCHNAQEPYFHQSVEKLHTHIWIG